jgi:hypothetical protein
LALLHRLGLWEFWRRAHAYTLTHQRLIETQGIISRTESSLPLFFVQDASLQTWLFPRWGSVSVSTAGEKGGFTETPWLRRDDSCPHFADRTGGRRFALAGRPRGRPADRVIIRTLNKALWRTPTSAASAHYVGRRGWSH